MACKLKKHYFAVFEVLTEVLLRFQAFWEVTLLCGVVWYQALQMIMLPSCSIHCVPLKVKLSWHYKMPDTTHPMTQHHIPGDSNLWVKIPASRTTKSVLYWFGAKKLLHLLNKTTCIQVWVKWTYTGLSRTFLLPVYVSYQVHVLCVAVFEMYQIFVFTCFIVWNILFQL